jgi:hypothetical protein
VLKSNVSAFLVIFLFIVFPSSSVLATKGNESFVDQNMVNKNFNISSLAYDLNSAPFNTSYTDRTAKWWQWTYSIPWNKNPSYDDTGKYWGENQHGPVWFLTLAFEHPVERTCHIPQNTALLITLLNSECSYAEYKNLETEEELTDCAKEMQDVVNGAEASLNDITMPNAEKYHI